jgi:hypothetical protein
MEKKISHIVGNHDDDDGDGSSMKRKKKAQSSLLNSKFLKESLNKKNSK